MTELIWYDLTNILVLKVCSLDSRIAEQAAERSLQGSPTVSPVTAASESALSLPPLFCQSWGEARACDLRRGEACTHVHVRRWGGAMRLRSLRLTCVAKSFALWSNRRPISSHVHVPDVSSAVSHPVWTDPNSSEHRLVCHATLSTMHALLDVPQRTGQLAEAKAE